QPRVLRARNYSEKTAELIDAEVRRIVDEAQARATTVLRDHRALLDRIANTLLEFETLQGQQLNDLLTSEEQEGAVNAAARSAYAVGQVPMEAGEAAATLANRSNKTGTGLALQRSVRF